MEEKKELLDQDERVVEIELEYLEKRNAIAYGAYIIISIPPPSGGTNSNESVLRL